jgi:RHS repeat-associated protein
MARCQEDYFTGGRTGVLIAAHNDSYSNIDEMGARWYSPLIGRFLTADNIVPRPGDPQSMNRFSYAGNSPLNRLDPSGHFDISSFAAGFSDEYVDDLTLGLHSSMNVNVAERMRSDESVEYATGRVSGQLAAILFAGTEMGSGGTLAGGSIAAGGGCAVLTIGACAPIGAAVAVGGATVGVGIVGHGLLIAGKVLSNGDPLRNYVLASDSAKLAENLGPRPTSDAAAHHIIPAGDERAASLRQQLAKAGIGINDAANGVFLPGDSKASALPGHPNAAIHSRLNTNRYYVELERRLSGVDTNKINTVLDQIRKDLLAGTFQYQ